MGGDVGAYVTGRKGEGVNSQWCHLEKCSRSECQRWLRTGTRPLNKHRAKECGLDAQGIRDIVWLLTTTV